MTSDQAPPDMTVTIEPARDWTAQSSNIAGVGYDEATKTLEVRFQNATRYRYGGVPADVAEPLLVSLGDASRPRLTDGTPAAFSPGSYLYTAIKLSHPVQQCLRSWAELDA